MLVLLWGFDKRPQRKASSLLYLTGTFEKQQYWSDER